ncbi:YndM family protein [Bacillus songklensis]|uniref:YndM family protein n=1 Tax=Bacillus songklensis TaxID=1069116 RepID=A0ABV8B3X6_9BACI
MRHVLAFSIKFMATLVVLGVVLGLFNNLSIVDVLTISIVLSAVGYIIGDLFILRRTNNSVASLADFGLAFLVIWSMSRNLAYVNDLFAGSLISALGITVFEIFYHRIVPRNAGRTEIPNQNQRQRNTRLNTEASEELTPVRPDVRSPKEYNDNKNKDENK